MANSPSQSPSRSTGFFGSIKNVALILRKIYRTLTITRAGVKGVLDSADSTGLITVSAKTPAMTKWARDALSNLEVEVHTIGEPCKRPILMLGNHVSYLDIPVLMAVTPVVFVAKKQLAQWPLFGKAMKSVGTVFVDRDNRKSRQNTAEALAPAILERQQSVAIFPSGTTTMDEAKPWRWGAFTLAKRYQIEVQPFRIRYTPLRTAAYILDDAFLPHLWRLSANGPIQCYIEFHEPVRITDPKKDAQHWWKWAKEIHSAKD